MNGPAVLFVRWIASMPCTGTGAMTNSPCRLNDGEDPEEYCLVCAARQFLDTGRWPPNVAAKLVSLDP